MMLSCEKEIQTHGSWGCVCTEKKTPIVGPARGRLPETKTPDFEASRNGGGMYTVIPYTTLSFPQKIIKHTKRKTKTKQTKKRTKRKTV